jgi:hypothetical protein
MIIKVDFKLITEVGISKLKNFKNITKLQLYNKCNIFDIK